jgi:hypothetical protein
MHVVATFAAVVRRFDEAAAAAAAAQASATANAVAPPEMLEQIMELAGWRTHHAMARASASCAQSAATRLRFDISAEARSLAYLRPVTNAQGTLSFMGFTINYRKGGGGHGNGTGRATEIECKPDSGSVCSGEDE